MSDKDIEQEPVSAEEDTAPVEETTVEKPARSGNSIGWLAFLVAIIALAASGYMIWQVWQATSDTTASDNYARLDDRVSATSSSLSDLEARVAELGNRDPGVDAAVDALRQEVNERIRLLDSLPARISTLESSIASLAGVSEGARDAWILAESEYYMQIANAQLQLANNPHLAALALKMADERIVQLANPALTDVRRAISDELAALDLMEKPDVEGATLMLGSLARIVDSLPLAGPADADEDAPAIDPELSGPKLVQLSPDAEFFLRNHIALQLQSARLALLRGEQAIFEQTLDDTSALLRDYFDTDSAPVAGALETIAEIRGHVFTTDAPDISGSLQLLRQYRTLQESAQ